MVIMRSVVFAFGRVLVRVWTYWMADIGKRQSFGGKAASVGIGLFVLCCICSFGHTVVRIGFHTSSPSISPSPLAFTITCNDLNPSAEHPIFDAALLIAHDQRAVTLGA